MKTKTLGLLLGMAPLFIFAWGATGCGGDHITFTLPDGDVVPWGGSLEVIADIKEQGNKPKDGAQVKFSLTAGSFEPFEEGRLTSPVRETQVGTLGGGATVTIFSFPGEGGSQGALIANYETIGHKALTESVQISIADGGKPSGRSLSAQCDPVNVTALDANGGMADPEMKIRCTLIVKDAANQAVPIADIQPKVEGSPACSIVAVPESNAGATHVFTLKADCLPRDVEPWADEPNHMFGGRIFNPRDGLLTVMFAVRGQEGFNDSNGNGMYDPGEGFVGQDQGEPFVDENDNGEWNDGEEIVDNNANGQWDPADGRWSDDVWISTSTHIMFSGPPHQSAETSHSIPPGLNIPDGGIETLTFYLVDQNHNPIAANGLSDQINFRPDDLTVNQGETQALLNEMGAIFNDGVLSPESLSSDVPCRRFSVEVADRHPGDVNPYPVSIQPIVRYTPAPNYDGYSTQRIELELNPITGTAN